LESSAAVSISPEERAANLARVKFSPAQTKQIISPNAGSILVKDEPVLPLSEPMREKASQVFTKHYGGGVTSEHKSAEDLGSFAPASALPTLIRECGFSGERIDAICTKINRINKQSFEREDFYEFVAAFYAPTYHYGQRLRRFAGRGECEEALQLIERGCDVNTGDGEGLTSLHYAAMFDKSSSIDALVKHSRSHIALDAKDRYGWTPLHCACYHGNLEAAKRLIAAGAVTNLPDKLGKTPLHLAAAQSRNSLCELLATQAGTTINTQDARGMTPLHEAAFNGHKKTYAMLLKANGADKSIKDVLGNTSEYYININSNSVS
jgi:hypothetical protein